MKSMMKWGRLPVLLMLVLWGITVNSCRDGDGSKYTGPDPSGSIETMDMTWEEAKEYLESLTQEYADNDSLINLDNVESIASNESVPLSDLVAGEEDMIRIEGSTYNIRVEMFNDETATDLMDALKSESDYAFGLCVDPDRFYVDGSSEIEFPIMQATVVDKEFTVNSLEASQPWYTDIDSIEASWTMSVEEFRAGLDYSLFVLSLEHMGYYEDDEPMNPETTGPYLAYKGIRLKVERDGISHEEFELWYSQPGADNQLVKYHWKFNGTTRLDASGTSRYFNDVNRKNHWYERPDNNLTCLIPLSSYEQNAVPWEDDWNSGLLDRVPDAWDPYRPLEIKSYDAFNCVTNYVDVNVVITSLITGTTQTNPPWAFDQDDGYYEAGMYRISQASVEARSDYGNIIFQTNDAMNGGLDDINLKLTLRYY